MALAHQTLVGRMTYRLKELLPSLGVDHGVIAEQLVEAVDDAVLRAMDQREADMTACIQKLLDTYGGWLQDCRGEIDRLKIERADLQLRLAKTEQVAEIASR